VGDVLDLGRVLFFSDGDNVRVGSPVIPGAVVRTEVVGNGRSKKIVVFKYRSKIRYRKKTGHRQSYTALTVREILVNSGE
jgi:large subunit ribosomal protein L21